MLQAGIKDAGPAVLNLMESRQAKPSVVTYGVIMQALCRADGQAELRSALSLLNELEARGVQTNSNLYTMLIQAFLRGIPTTPFKRGASGRHPYMDVALGLRARMAERKIPPSRILQHAVIHAALSQRTHDGMRVAIDTFEDLRRDRTGSSPGEADSWYVMLKGLVDLQEWDRARVVLDQMRHDGFKVRSKPLGRLVDIVNSRRRV